MYTSEHSTGWSSGRICSLVGYRDRISEHGDWDWFVQGCRYLLTYAQVWVWVKGSYICKHIDRIGQSRNPDNCVRDWLVQGPRICTQLHRIGWSRAADISAHVYMSGCSRASNICTHVLRIGWSRAPNIFTPVTGLVGIGPRISAHTYIDGSRAPNICTHIHWLV